MGESDAAAAPDFILVEPQMGENIGAAARAMRNFGLSRMRLVAPRDGWPNAKAVAMASGAGGVLEDARLFDTTEAALSDLTCVYAATARPRELTKRVLTPQAAMAEARARAAAGERVGVMFGPERAGLSNADIVLARAVVSVPVNPDFPSLNLAQCVLLFAYEWGRATREAPAETLAAGRTQRATGEEVGHLLDHLEKELDAAGFFWPEDKRPSMLANLRNLFRRADLTGQDARTLRGVVRALAEGRRRRG